MAKIDFKQATINHAEKAVFVLVLVFVVWALLSTNWVPYSGTPREITDKVSQGQQRLRSNTWPETEEEKFRLTEEDAPANIVHTRLFEKVNPIPWEMSAQFVSTPWGGNEPVTEPSLLALQQPLATSSRVLIQVASVDEETTADGETAETAETAEEDLSIPDEFRENTRNQRVQGGRGPGGRGGMGAEAAAAAAAEQAVRYAEEMAAQMSAQYNTDQYGGGSFGGQGSGRRGYAASSKLEGRGYHFVSVRAVFPLREQIQKFADAIHRPYTEAAALFEILDFELQRQVQRGNGEWSDWQSVDIQEALDVLDKAALTDPEVVNSMITNAVITMPLPSRITGMWGNQATHPAIEKFKLSDEQIQLETELQMKLFEEAAKNNYVERGAQRRGFASTQFDMRQLQADFFGGGSNFGYSPVNMSMMGSTSPMGRGRGRGQSGALGDLMQEMLKDGDFKDSDAKRRRIEEYIQKRFDAAGELLLFRYFDFGVEPGRTYRYRVRLELANPNYGKRISDAGGLQHVVEGETRMTPWSDITTPVTVEPAMKYFVASIREQINRVLPSVSFDSFSWDSKYGTFMNSILDVRIGQKVGDEVTTTVIDPTEGLYEEKKYQFLSDDFLVDTREEFRIDPEFHKTGPNGVEVQIDQVVPGRLRLLPNALVKTSADQLRTVLPRDRSTEYESQKKIMEYQGDQFAYLKDAGRGDPNALDDAYRDLIGMPDSAQQATTGPRQFNPNRKRSGRR